MVEVNTPGESEPDVYVNAHRMRVVSSDIIRIWWIGRCTREDFNRVFEYSERRMESRRHFVLADFSQLKTIDADARKQASEDPRIHLIAGLAVIGTTFHTRVLLDLLMKAVEIFQPGKQGRTRFFATEQQAFAWIAEERERLGLGATKSHQG